MQVITNQQILVIQTDADSEVQFITEMQQGPKGAIGPPGPPGPPGPQGPPGVAFISNDIDNSISLGSDNGIYCPAVIFQALHW